MSQLAVQKNSAWTIGETEEFLRQAVIPLRLAFTDSNGAPAITPLWFLYEDGQLLCATQGSAHTVKRLTAKPACGFDISVEQPPYCGVRGQARAVVRPGGGELLGRLIDRYLGGRESELARWLLARSADEVTLALRPDWITAWDFRHRMPRPRDAG